MTKFWAICKNTFLQTIRQPMYALLIFLTMLVLVMGLMLSNWTMNPDGEYQKSDQVMMCSMGLTTLLISGMLIAAFSASSVVSREIEDRTALTVISKPVSRAAFVLGKFAGVTGAVVIAFYICSLAFLMTVRHGVKSAAYMPFDYPVIILGCSALLLTVLVPAVGNFMFGWSFLSSSVWAGITIFTVAMGVIGFIGKGWEIVPFGKEIPPQLLVALLLIFLAVLVLVAVAVTASTRLGQIMTLLVCFGAMVVGTIHEALFGKNADAISHALGYVMPKLTYYFNLTPEKDIPVSYIGLATLHCLLYTAGVLGLGVSLFQKRALEADAGSTSTPGAVGLLAWAGRIAALLAGLAGARLLLAPDNQNAMGVIVSAGVVTAAAAAWLLWGYFGRGIRWSYWVVLVLSAAWLLVSVLPLTLPAARQLQANQTPQMLFLETILALAVLVILSFPKTRRHFTSASM